VNQSDNALEQLISQFAQPLAFLRELIQNSLDAGTTLIEVDVDFDSESKACFVRVADNGHGMDREIIDGRLTKLFASTKEDDLTKIGKFGIGFVSIFAIKPELVVLETGQHGEAWRLLFLPDRSFERHKLNEPREGTSVTVFLNRPKKELENLCRECRSTVAFWCKHSHVDIRFNGTSINEQFDLEKGAYQYRFSSGETEIVLRPSAKKDGFQGYYNRGLTLLEGEGSPIPYLEFKIRSPYLEHTLSRDNIKKDENYEKAMDLLRVAAFQKMPQHLFSLLEKKAEPDLWRYAVRLLKFDDEIIDSVRGRKVFPAREGWVALNDLENPVYYSDSESELRTAVEESGEVVLSLANELESLRKFLFQMHYELVPVENAFFHYRVVREPETAEQALLDALKRASRQIFRSPILVEPLNVPSQWERRFSAYLHPRGEIEKDFGGDRGWRESMGVRRDHPLWKQLLALYEVQPELAVSLLTRMVNLELRGNLGLEAKLFNRLAKSVREGVTS